MEINLVPVKPEEKSALANLYQLYYYDFSEFTNQDINIDGRYDVNIDFFWEGDHRWKPYLIEVSGRLVGFIIVLLENLDLDPDPMIIKKFRRNGIGYAAAIKAFELYKGNWKIAQMETNTPALSFWRKVIKDFTKNNFTESFKDDVKKYVQAFSTKQ
jgi:predicted acetyltransferase